MNKDHIINGARYCFYDACLVLKINYDFIYIYHYNDRRYLFARMRVDAEVTVVPPLRLSLRKQPPKPGSLYPGGRQWLCSDRRCKSQSRGRPNNMAVAKLIPRDVKEGGKGQ